jgi:hypothetical protein
MKAPDPLNWVYLFYTLSAAILTYLNVSVTVRRRQSNILLILSRVGTAILTIGTFFDNLRTFLASFPSAMYPEAVTSAPNVTAANAAWKEINYSGANFQSGVFWFCGFNHIVLVAISCFTCVQFISVYKNMPCLGARIMFRVSSVMIFALFAFQVFAFISGPASGPLKLEEPRDGILTVTAANKALGLGLISVFAYTFGMFFVGIAAICREGAGLRCKNILFTVAVFLGLVLNGASGGAHGPMSVVGNFGEQLLFAVVLWFDFSHNNGEVGDNEVYLEV